jgi:hypothetical protein
MTESPAETASFSPDGNHSAVRSRVWRWLIVFLFLGAISGVYLHIGGLLIAQTNFTDQDILGGDQKNNIAMALKARDDLSPDFTEGVSEPLKQWFPHRTDGVVNPLWPWLAAWLVDPDHQASADNEVSAADRQLFNRGRHFHVGWTLGALIVIGIAAARSLSLAATLNVVLLIGFGAFLPRAAYFQPEPLFFALFLVTWVTCLQALHRNGLWIHAVMGVFGGLAYLAKGSVQPLLLAYIFISTARWAWGWVETWRGREGGTTLWLRRNHWLALIMMSFFFLMTAGPRLVYSAKTFGDPFHSFPGYWMWFDDFKDAYAWMGKHNTKAALEALPKSERPSFATYSASHTPEQMWSRLIDGTRIKVMELLSPPTTLRGTKQAKPWKGVLEWRGWYLGALFGIFGSLAIALRWRCPPPLNPAQRLHPETVSKTLFVILAVVGYSLAYGWYTPIGRGDRFMLSLYAPLVVSLVWAGESMLRRARRRQCAAWLPIAYHTAHSALALAIAWRLVEILRHPYFIND